MGKSYFQRVSALLARVTNQIKQSSTGADSAKDCFEGTTALVKQAASETELTRTQDLKVLLPKFSISLAGEINDTNRPVGHSETTFLDKLNRLTIRDDPAYSRYKFDRKSNFKKNLINSLGLLDNEALY